MGGDGRFVEQPPREGVRLGRELERPVDLALRLGVEGDDRLQRRRDALERRFRALAAGDGPVLVNVLTDPSVAYPRSANLA